MCRDLLDSGKNTPERKDSIMENQGRSGGQVIILSFHGPRRGAEEVGLARKLRHEFPGACYDGINRGINRRDFFGTAAAAIAFGTCLFSHHVKKAISY